MLAKMSLQFGDKCKHRNFDFDLTTNFTSVFTERLQETQKVLNETTLEGVIKRIYEFGINLP